MGLELGDTITLDILGERLTATVASARRMDYTTFQLNFALMLSPGVIDDFPQTYLATVHLDTDSKAKAATIRSISEAFPNVTTIHTTEAVARVKEILNHIATALTITVLVSLLAGLLVLSSALSAMLGYRLYDTAVLKVLGARRHDILRAYTTEWMLLALITICVASAIGTFGAWLILQRFPGENTFFFMPEVTLITAGICIAVIWLVGYVGNRQVFRLRPASLLRNE
jgi:putative ABC transport system permease protein